MVLEKIDKLAGGEEINNKKIANAILMYIFKNKKIDLSVTELAELSNVSQPSVSRFVKAVDIETYKEMKNLIDLEIPNFFGNQEIYYKTDIDKLTKDIYLSVDEINKDSIYEAAKMLNSAGKVNITGIGGNQSLMTEIQHKLSQVGKITMYSSDWHHQLLNVNYMEKSDVLIAISYSGETSEVIKVVNEAKAKGIKIISITGDFDSTLTKLSDIVVAIKSREGKFRPFLFNGRVIAFILWEMIFEEMLSQNPKLTKIIEDWVWKNL